MLLICKIPTWFTNIIPRGYLFAFNVDLFGFFRFSIIPSIFRQTFIAQLELALTTDINQHAMTP